MKLTLLGILVLCVTMKVSSLTPPLVSSQNISDQRLDASDNLISSLLDAIPVDVWEDASASLLEKGVATGKIRSLVTEN